MRRIFFAIAVLLVAGGNAQAFEKSSAGGKQGDAGVAAAKPLDLSAGKVLDTGKGDSGIRIPGLGSLGVLPKLDFGLELLYGDGQTQAATPEDVEPDTDGLRIRGTLKHRF